MSRKADVDGPSHLELYVRSAYESVGGLACLCTLSCFLLANRVYAMPTTLDMGSCVRLAELRLSCKPTSCIRRQTTLAARMTTAGEDWYWTLEHTIVLLRAA